MKWKELTTIGQLDRIDELSNAHPVLIFKHSTRCPISKAALNRLERAWTAEDAERHRVYYLDLLAHRDISDAVATRYGIEHESPQVLVIRNGSCAQHHSHMAISYAETMEAMKG
ncbi:MAG TPA: bacillithiol system redox-active protein YtxJ [Flavobacteriales bacterium]|nr:bacillithiol system redox-active protein YtxJ [Flavobacteriales bacterium]HRO39225.1 bacillithiol system redox-active protein YtxJ [Flavobacteriales bacterium]HRP81089.1 bacillithiol system redox-active protein YtxJ [Flavobacteriales bacterium]HRQ83669.1 bacillithiol system redox-active protein YtxJ [Flavobacteriales bacterium]